MTADKDALLREALETLQSIGTPQHYDYRRIAALIARITAALEDKAIMEAKRPEPVVFVHETYAAETREVEQHDVVLKSDYDNLLTAYHRMAAERDAAVEGNKLWRDRRDAALNAQETAERQLAELQAEHDALVKDAARYRWLCDNANLSLGGLKAQPYIELDRWALMGTRDIDLDAAIDAAMSAVALREGSDGANL